MGEVKVVRISAMRERVLHARIAELEEALRPFANRHTIAELMSGEVPNDWVKASTERRIEMIGERKRANDAAILRARSVLSKGED